MLERVLGDPEMTVYLGGPETPEQIRERHERYLRCRPGQDQMFVILAGPAKQPAGLVGYWEHDWQGQQVKEIGWSVLIEFQGKGVATRAATLAAQHARAEGSFRYLHAFAAVDNAPSNAVCRKIGFELIGQVDMEDRPGQIMRCNEWRLDLIEALE